MAPPLWKVRREAARLGRQLRELPGDLHNFFFATLLYDRKVASKIRRFEGARPLTDRVVVFLIYPKAGLQSSHLRAFDYFGRKGYAVLAVSNLRLDEADRALLLQHCWAYLERPNFGYDFGGYRDAILSLSDDLEHLERLIIFNDSTWFPLPGTRDWLEDAESMGADLVAAASNYGTPRTDIENFHSLEWTYSHTHRNFHYCSFALFMRPKLFRSAAFLRFWKHLRLSDKKKRTVRRGEIGFSQWVFAHGFSHAATLDVSHLDQELDGLDDERLREVAQRLIIPEDPKLRAFQASVLADRATVREDLIKLILIVVSRQGSSYALAPYSVLDRGFPFLKKSPLWLSSESARASLNLLADLPGQGSNSIRNEALALTGQLSVESELRSQKSLLGMKSRMK